LCLNLITDGILKQLPPPEYICFPS
jgi:hypothetical protein